MNTNRWVAPIGPGTELARILSAMGFKKGSGCKCKEFEKEMNIRGPEWVSRNIHTVTGWLQSSAQHRKLPFSKLIARGLIMNANGKARKKRNNIFARCWCVTLNRRKDRWNRFEDGVPQDWPFAPIQKFDAVDGQLCPPPEWWTAGRGAWGCYRSHMKIIEHCLNHKIDSVLLLEDDAVFCADFTNRVNEFLEHVPEDWGMIYLGGQHLMVAKNPPKRVNDWVFQPYNINRTHAFALRGQTMRDVYKHLSRMDWHRGHHIDHHLGRFHQRRTHPIFCPKEWLVGQAEGKSNISNRDNPEKFWKAAEVIADVDPTKEPFVAVIGLHSSGSSCLAGVLYHLGIHMGNELGGYYGTNPDKNCGFEASGLASICESAVPFPSTEYRWKRGKIWSHLRGWINDRRSEAAEMKTIAGGKYPQLCRMGNQLQNLCGEHLRLIVSDRNIQSSIDSLVKRSKGRFPDAELEAHQRWLHKGKQELVASMEPGKVLVVDFDALVEDPRHQINRIITFLDLPTDEAKIQRAIAHVNPALNHHPGVAS